MTKNTLTDIRIVLPETRQLDQLTTMLEKEQATVIRCPLVAILDNPDTAPVESWLQKFIAAPPHLFIIMTGEGLRRLVGFAQRLDLQKAFIATVADTSKLVRGPKPVIALREIGLEPDIRAAAPTTDGIIETLTRMDIENHQIGIQLYGQEPNEKLMDYLNSRQVDPQPVAPYVYASEADDAQVLKLIHDLQNGQVDVLAFTSASQFKRLRKVAQANNLENQMVENLNKIKVAAVGPVMAQELIDAGVQVHIQPAEKFFMKPLVNRIVESFNTRG